MDRIKSFIISFAALTLILSAAVILSIPAEENRFTTRVKREDRILFGGENILSGAFVHEQPSPGENGMTFQQITEYEDNNGKKGKIYFYAHSIQTFTEYSFYEELLEIQVKVKGERGKGESFVDAYLIEDTGDGVLLEMALPLAGVDLALVLLRDTLKKNDDYLLVTGVSLRFDPPSGGNLSLGETRVYAWDPEPEKPQLAVYDDDGGLSVPDNFRGDLF